MGHVAPVVAPGATNLPSVTGAVSTPRPREPMPSLATISRAWEGLGEKRLREIFPELACFGIGWGEPFCFRCGWLSPSKEAADYPDNWPAGRAIDAAWQASRGWLERCHLQDHYYGGSADALNLVPLCVLCHEEQPQCKTRAAGIAFVNSASPRKGIVPWMQMLTDELGRGIKRPGREKALRKMLRAQAILAVAQNQTIKELEREMNQLGKGVENEGALADEAGARPGAADLSSHGDSPEAPAYSGRRSKPLPDERVEGGANDRSGAMP